MDILAGPGTAPKAAAMPDPLPRQALLSTQVTDARYFFLGLADERRPGLMPAYGGFERCDPDYVVLRDTPGFASMELIVGGRGSVLLNGTATPLRAGLLFYYDTRTRLEIRTDPAQPLAKYFLCFHGRSVNRRLAAAGLRPGGLVQLAMFTEVQRLWDELIREGGHHRPTAGRLCAALTEVLLLKIEELAGLSVSPGRAAEEAFLRCKGMIEARAASLATLADITRATGVGPTRLSRLFRRYQGLSPYQFLLHRKMALAAELMMNPATLVKEAAAQVGFADPYHFSRCFKQVHRVAPKDFQRSLKHV
jgi:AraC family transcriptional regulator